MALARVEIVFQRYPGTAGSAADRAVPNVDFTVTIGKHTSKGKTHADGKLTIDMPADSTAILEIFGTRYAVKPVKKLEELTDIRGIQRRLEGLGYELGYVDGDVGPRTGRAILAFQADNAIDTHGETNQPTKDALANQFGS